MPLTQIRGSTQIILNSISLDRLVANWDTTLLKKDGSVALTADWSAGGFKVTNLADAIAAQDAVNLRTMQSYINGVAVKPAVDYSAVANYTLTGLPTPDGTAMSAGEIILLTNQTALSQNGPWIVAAGAWARPVWWTAASTQKPALFYVMRGAARADTKWTTITDGNITVDTTSITIQQDSSGSTYTNGNGLSLTGSTFAVKLGFGIQFDGSFNVTAKPDAARLVAVDTNGIGITNGTSAQLIVAGAGGAAAWASMSGDVTISNSGVSSINRVAGSGFLKYTDVVTNETPGGLVNGANTAFTLATAAQNVSAQLYYNGLLLEAGAGNDYTIAGTAITMLWTPQTGDKLRVNYIK